MKRITVSILFAALVLAGGAAWAQTTLVYGTTDKVTVVPGLSSSISRMAARDNSRVLWPPIDSMTSPSTRCSLSAGEPGTTLSIAGCPAPSYSADHGVTVSRSSEPG